jgi:ADP-ribose pyrophosphatase YjhB (NUDIX family)
VADLSRTQRLGAYAVVLHDGNMLLTRISSAGFPVGMWTLPGGGVDHGEHPDAAVVRELYEETGLEALTVRLVDVGSIHLVGPGRDGADEDYHGVHLLYAVTVDPSIEPHVVEVGGTTDLAAWIPLDDIRSGTQQLASMIPRALERLDQFGGG